jgi:uncharacterized membrane protein
MKSKFAEVWHSLRDSIWFLPGLMTLTAALLSAVTLHLDQRLDIETAHGSPYLFTGAADGARSVLTVIGQTIITVAGVVFSVTITTLALAAAQYGPMVLRNFMGDRGNQIVLGTFISTYLFSLLVLRKVHGDEGEPFVPHVSVTVALVLAVLSLGVLIYFIHHVSSSIEATHLIERVSKDLEAAIDRRFPDEMGDDPGVPVEEFVMTPPTQGGVTVRAPAGGYVQAIDSEGLLEAAITVGGMISVQPRPGEFVAEFDPLAWVYPKSGKLEKEQFRTISKAFSLERQQTMFQDVGFGIDQLAEISVRAQSTGINDPYTTLRCLDRLGAALCRFCNRRMPDPHRVDEDGEVRVVIRGFDFQDAVQRAIDPIRHHGSKDPAVVKHLLRTLMKVALCVRTESQLEAIRQQVAAIGEAAAMREWPSHDRESVEEFLEAAEAACNLKEPGLGKE